jgi:hypothetical protein
MGAGSAGGIEAVAAINEQFLAMSDRTNQYAGYAPRQIEWQTEAMMAAGRGMISDISDSTAAMLRREASAELGSFYRFMAEQRALISVYLANEREAVLNAIAGERNEVLTYLVNERIAVFQALAEERTIVMEEINALSLSAMDKAVAQSRMTVESGIDRVFDSTIQILLIPMVLILVFAVIIMIWIRNTVERILKMHESRGDSG